MMKRGMRVQSNLFLIQVVGTRVMVFEDCEVRIEIAPIFLVLVTDISPPTTAFYSMYTAQSPVTRGPVW